MFKSLKIKSIKKIEHNSKRYDLETKKNHNFFANGILVHNSSFGFSKKGKNELEFFAREGKPISIFSRTAMNIYEEAVDYVVSGDEDGLFDFLGDNFLIQTEYFFKGIKPIIPVKIKPKNNMIVLKVTKNGKELPIEEAIKVAKKINLSPPPLLFKGKFNNQQKNQILHFLKMDDEERKRVFKSDSFVEFISKLTTSKEFIINDEIIEGVVFQFSGEKPILAKVVDPIFTNTIVGKKKDNEFDEEMETYQSQVLTIVKFLINHFYDDFMFFQKQNTGLFATKDMAYLHTIQDVFLKNKDYLKKVLNTLKLPEGKKNIFNMNDKYLKDDFKSFLKSNEILKDIFISFLLNLTSVKKRVTKKFNKEEISFINSFINSIFKI